MIKRFIETDTDLLFSRAQLERLGACKRLIVGYSGGLDSTAVLHALCREIPPSIPVLALHINHQLSPEADNWEAHCMAFCASLARARDNAKTSAKPNPAFHAVKVDIDQTQDLENAARKARYAVFMEFVQQGDGLVLAHHRGDQVETFFLQLFRGAGVDGMAAMPMLHSFGKGTVYRPLLDYPKSRLETYVKHHQLSYIEDASNQDTRFSRNYIRHQILPMIKTRWPSLETNICRTVSHCQQARENLDSLAALDEAGFASNALDENPAPRDGLQIADSVSIEFLTSLSEARQKNYLRYCLKNHGVPRPSGQIFERIFRELIPARPDARPEVDWGNYILRRYKQGLYLERKTNIPAVLKSHEWQNFPETFHMPDYGLAIAVQNPPLFLRKSVITVSFRQGGESIRIRGKQRSLKKLFQEWNIPPWLRDRIPLIYADEQLISVIAYANADSLGANCQFTHEA